MTDDFDDEIIEEDVEEKGIKGKLDKLKKDLKKCQAERQEYLDGWQRARADYANQKRENEERLRNAGTFAEANIVSELLPVLDSFDAAFSNKKLWQQVDENWRRGIEQIHNQFHDVLKKFNITIIDKSDIPFDPAVHEPLLIVETNKEDRDNYVAEVLQKGYKIKDKILRPAKVKIYKHNQQ